MAIVEILEKKLENKYSIRKIQVALKDATCRKITSGIYSLNKQDEVYRALEISHGVSLNQKNYRPKKASKVMPSKLTKIVKLNLIK